MSVKGIFCHCSLFTDVKFQRMWRGLSQDVFWLFQPYTEPSFRECQRGYFMMYFVISVFYRCSVPENVKGVISGCELKVTDHDTGSNGKVKLSVQVRCLLNIQELLPLFRLDVCIILKSCYPLKVRISYCRGLSRHVSLYIVSEILTHYTKLVSTAIEKLQNKI